MEYKAYGYIGNPENRILIAGFDTPGRARLIVRTHLLPNMLAGNITCCDKKACYGTEGDRFDGIILEYPGGATEQVPAGAADSEKKKPFYEIECVKDLAVTLRNRETWDLTKKAILAAAALSESGDDVSKLDHLAALSIRIFNELPYGDGSGFSSHGYMDGFLHPRGNVDIKKLLALDADEFIEAMTWLAEDRRNTYEEQEHPHGPLAIDIYEE